MKLNFLLVGVLTLVATTSCHSDKHHAEEKGHFLATSPLVQDTTITKQYVSQIRSIRHIEIRSQERGYLEKIFVDEGQFVHKGQLLFQIMPNVYNAEFHKTEAELEASRIEVLNAQTLFDKNVVSPNELALAKAKYKRAEADMELAKAHLQFTRITAPYDGYVDHLNLRLGSLVDEGDLLTSLSDNSQMWVYFNVPEAEYLNYMNNADEHNLNEVKLFLANQQVFDQSGKVETIEADFNNETGNIAFRATFPNKKNVLRNGQTGTILMAVPMEHAVIIPQKASFEIMDKKYVYVIDAHNHVKLTPITVKAEMPDLFIINSGLKGQEKILLEGIRKVQDGDEVEVKYESPRMAFSKLSLASE
ncbi:efflux RND transporter periplasmic adaptor subunit [Sphingobacterium corticis]|uniref:Efflux RND transporter periplasmic adaptor subunit n=1 Tax=Sphingobacterium corticis TaxID=1812823 RepID=A0ABW5NN98_9SPHI